MQELLHSLQTLDKCEDYFPKIETINLLLGYDEVISRILPKTNDNRQKILIPFKIQTQLFSACSINGSSNQTETTQIIIRLIYNFVKNLQKEIRIIICVELYKFDSEQAEKLQKLMSIIKKALNFQRDSSKKIFFVIFTQKKEFEYKMLEEKIKFLYKNIQLLVQAVCNENQFWISNSKQNLFTQKQFFVRIQQAKPFSGKKIPYNLTDSYKLKLRMFFEESVFNIVQRLKGAVIKIQMKMRNSFLCQQINLRQRIQLQTQIIQFLQAKIRQNTLTDFLNFFKNKYGMLSAFTELEHDLKTIQLFRTIYEKVDIYNTDITTQLENILNIKLFEQRRQFHQLHKISLKQNNLDYQIQQSKLVKPVQNNCQENKQQITVLGCFPIHKQLKSINNEHAQKLKIRTHQRHYSNIEQSYKQRQQTKQSTKDFLKTNKVRDLKTRLSKQLILAKKQLSQDLIPEIKQQHKRSRSDNPLQNPSKIQQLANSLKFEKHIDELKSQKIQHQMKKMDYIFEPKAPLQIYQSMKRRSKNYKKQDSIVNNSSIKRYSQKWSNYLHA